MICKRCGAKNAKNRQTCYFCGARLQETESQSSTPRPPMLEVTAREVRVEPVKRRIRLSTRFAYGVLTSRMRYRNTFLLLASLTVAVLSLVLVGLEMPRVLTEAISATATPGGFEAWRMAWSGVIVTAGLAAWIVFCLLVGYKMVKIRRVFRRKGRRMEPLPR